MTPLKWKTRYLKPAKANLLGYADLPAWSDWSGVLVLEGL